jgi:hypothetical protein
MNVEQMLRAGSKEDLKEEDEWMKFLNGLFDWNREIDKYAQGDSDER